MQMQRLLGVAAVLVAAAVAWKYRHDLSALAVAEAPPPAPFVFDNGSVRERPVRDDAAASAPRSLPRGVLRKCVRGSETSYTNVECPPGTKERRVDDSRVTVLETGGSARPASTPASAPTSASEGGARKTLRDALDLNGPDPQLRERAIDRAIQGSGR